MDEVAFQDWPGPPADMNSGSNPWMPAYGYQTPPALLEKEDFIGNPDAEYFLHGSAGQYMYLETIQEETSDDLRSESDAGSRSSPLGWFATDSEDGSVICIGRMDDAECESDREIACPPKRRKQDSFLSLPGVDDEDENSISRSSSLLQFETLEKECQQESQSPSAFTHFSFEPLDLIKAKREFIDQDFSSVYNRDFFTNLGDELNRSKRNDSRDSLLYNASTRYSSSDSGDSDITVENSRSCDNLKTWRSLDNLLLAGSNGSKKFSSENLSEDSGYGEQLLSSLNNSGQGKVVTFQANVWDHMVESSRSECEGMAKTPGEAGLRKKNGAVGFGAYDCDVYQHFNSNFGVSYQDLSIFDRYDPFNEPLSKSSPLTDVFLRKKHAQQLLNANSPGQTHSTNVNIIIDPENSYSKSVKFSHGGVSHAASVPNLLQSIERLPVDIQDSVVNVSSVPKDLNFIGKFSGPTAASVAEKDWNLADLSLSAKSESFKDGLALEGEEEDRLSLCSAESDEMATYKREGSYDIAMSNRVDLSDDEGSLTYKQKLPQTPIINFDKRVLKAISEQSLQSLIGSSASLHGSQKYLVQAETYQQRSAFSTSTPTRRYQNKSVAMSTPDLNRIDPAIKRNKDVYLDDERRKSTQEISASKYDTTRLEEERSKNILLDCSNDESEGNVQRKGSIIKSSTSTSGMSDIEDKTLHSVKSFTGSNGSKGVHFSPVVAEVNWHDDASTSTVTPDRESIYSLNSSSPEPCGVSPRPVVVKPKPQYPPSRARRSLSQPDISDTESRIYKREFIDSFNVLRKEEDISKSQPDVSRLKRRGSQLLKKDRDGCIVKAYTLDGVQYQHTHLDLKSLSQSSLVGSNTALNAKPGGIGGANQNVSASKNSLTSKFPFYGPSSHGGTEEDRPVVKQSNIGKQSSTGAMADRANATSDDEPRSKRKNKSGLGGFLHRLASFRLGVKKGQEQKGKLKRKTQGNGTAASVLSPNQKNPNFSNNANQKPNYIYIPLKGPSALENNNSSVLDGPVCAAKPPLPKQPPPRVVHASVKKTHAHNGGVGTEYDRRRRRTIDSASGTVEIRDAGRHGNASMDGPMGLIETDLDTEVTIITNGANAKARSLLDLGHEPRLQVPQNADGSQSNSSRPHKSMEFLLDKQNLKVVEPPENELQKTERVMSEHELRVQRSLQKLTVPDWYKNSQIPAQGFLLKKSRETRYYGTGSKTTSLSSLGSGAQSPLVLSPTPSSQPFVRWSTSKLNSTASSPCQSTRSSFNQGRQPNGSISPSSARSSFNYRQPYLGWRSQERLNRPRTPAERLASSLLSKQGPAIQQENPEIQTSIKEVTSAIVHYVSGLKPAVDDNLENSSRRSSSVSPKGSQKLCWLESSFVGTKPVDSPETPVTCSESPVPPHSLRLDLQNHSSNDLTTLSAGDTTVRPSPSATTLEDVLDSLLGLPPSGRSASPCLQETVSASTSPQRRSSDADTNDAYRRRSEGSEPASVNVDPSLPTPVLLRCRYSRCGKTAMPMSKEAKSFKNCHNCSYTYCSRACRRSHWERHRKTCLFSRMGTLCRQVIQAVRDQKDTLKELSKVARRGYISHGLGAVKCFYPNPEAAEKFLAEGLPSLGELTFVRWQNLLPTEMGPMLYKELVEMCQNYNSETKFVLYISLCVVSETPASGAIKWERQLVSRCAKLRLSKDLNFVGPERDAETPETLILTCPPIHLPTPETRMRARLIAFNTIQSQMKLRGISLKRQYPELYKQLDSYCEDLSVKFEAQTIYPRNAITNKSFMCIIMLESDPETLKHVEKAGVKVRTVDCLLSSETTTTL
ncbi:serine-rich adhesin for platelets isoform X1 [Euwallacea fornicatus]|uniref:serine-rich adhesin for platelets isoform X1 n=1 Tax=Euwallacea fornicatus TaxID=995702 RepID=UPI00338D6E77